MDEKTRNKAFWTIFGMMMVLLICITASYLAGVFATWYALKDLLY